MAIFKKLSIAAITLLLGVGAQNQGQLCTGETSFNVGFCSLDDTNSCISRGYNAEKATDGSCGGSVLLTSPSWLITKNTCCVPHSGGSSGQCSNAPGFPGAGFCLEDDFDSDEVRLCTDNFAVAASSQGCPENLLVPFHFPSNVLIPLQCCLLS
jgi:hypothetical protein